MKTRKTAAAIIAATKSASRIQGLRQQERHPDEAGDERRKHEPCVIGEGAVPRDPAPELTNLGRADGGDPAADGRATEEDRSP